jgi:5-hydroxyisourate hydrolase-like protein (transthyretin family)
MGPLLAPGVANAAAKKANAVGNQNNCSAAVTDHVVVATDYGWDVDCFSGSGTESVGLYHVTALETGSYRLTFTWKDYDGNTHTSTYKPWVLLAAGNAGSSGFAGYSSIAKITSITLYPLTALEPYSCNTGYGVAIYIATHESGAAEYYVDCFSATGTHSVGLYGVYALETGAYTLKFTWKDYNGGTHTSTKASSTFLAAGNAGPDGFMGYESMAKITSITIS